MTHQTSGNEPFAPSKPFDSLVRDPIFPAPFTFDHCHVLNAVGMVMAAGRRVLLQDKDPAGPDLVGKMPCHYLQVDRDPNKWLRSLFEFFFECVD